MRRKRWIIDMTDEHIYHLVHPPKVPQLTMDQCLSYTPTHSPTKTTRYTSLHIWQNFRIFTDNQSGRMLSLVSAVPMCGRTALNLCNMLSNKMSRNIFCYDCSGLDKGRQVTETIKMWHCVYVVCNSKSLERSCSHTLTFSPPVPEIPCNISRYV